MTAPHENKAEKRAESTQQPLVDQLVGVVRRLTAAQLELAELAAKHREALRNADGSRITALAFDRDRVNAGIVELNSERAAIAAALMQTLGMQTPDGAAAPRLGELLRAIGEPGAGALASAADDLRTAIAATQREHSILRDATAAIAGQLGGVLTRVLGACSGSNTYTASGRVAVGVMGPSTLDVRH